MAAMRSSSSVASSKVVGVQCTLVTVVTSLASTVAGNHSSLPAVMAMVPLSVSMLVVVTSSAAASM